MASGVTDKEPREASAQRLLRTKQEGVHSFVGGHRDGQWGREKSCAAWSHFKDGTHWN